VAPFWGLRTTCPRRKVDPLRCHQPAKPSVLLVVDPAICNGLPPEQKTRLLEFAAPRSDAWVPRAAGGGTRFGAARPSAAGFARSPEAWS
jgi:hypothetical protein